MIEQEQASKFNNVLRNWIDSIPLLDVSSIQVYQEQNNLTKQVFFQKEILVAKTNSIYKGQKYSGPD